MDSSPASPARARFLLPLLAVAACNDGGLPPGAGATDLAAALADLGAPADLAVPPDLARAHHLSFGPAQFVLGHFTGMPGTGWIGAVAVADFTRDGKPDLLRAWMPAGQNPPVQWVVNPGKGDGTIDFNDIASPAGCDSPPQGIVVADLDGDGELDIFAGDCTSASRIFRGVGDGTFRPAAPVAVALQSPVTGDLDGDGRLDVAGFSATGEVRPLWPQRDGSLAPGAAVTVGGQPRALVAADLDGDRRTDLIVTTPAAGGMPDRIQVLRGQANRTLAALPAMNLATAASCAVTGDLDRDGHVDLALRDAVLLGRGDGIFSGALPLPEGGYCPSGAADLDGDGVLDLAVGPELNAQGIDPARAYVRLGHGDGRFDPVIGFDAPMQIMVYRFGAPRLADWNADGKPDLFGFFYAFEADGVLSLINTSR